MIPTLFLASIIIFFATRFIPGDVIDMMAHQMRITAGILDRAALEHDLGLDVPILTQYRRWIGVVPQEDGSFSAIFQGDLGKSLWENPRGR